MTILYRQLRANLKPLNWFNDLPVIRAAWYKLYSIQSVGVVRSSLQFLPSKKPHAEVQRQLNVCSPSDMALHSVDLTSLYMTSPGV